MSDGIDHLPRLWRERSRGSESPAVRNVFDNAANHVEIAVRESSIITPQDALDSVRMIRRGVHTVGASEALKVVISELESGLNTTDTGSER